jgi:hypothetical protein
MIKRIGISIAALMLVAVAEVGQARLLPGPGPTPGPCFNRKRQCLPVPLPCTPGSPRSCGPVRGGR